MPTYTMRCHMGAPAYTVRKPNFWLAVESYARKLGYADSAQMARDYGGSVTDLAIGLIGRDRYENESRKGD